MFDFFAYLLISGYTDQKWYMKIVSSDLYMTV